MHTVLLSSNDKFDDDIGFDDDGKYMKTLKKNDVHVQRRMLQRITYCCNIDYRKRQRDRRKRWQHGE